MIWSCLIKLPHCHRILSHFKIGLILKNNISLHQHLPAEGGARDLKAFVIPVPGLKPFSPFFFCVEKWQFPRDCCSMPWMLIFRDFFLQWELLSRTPVSCSTWREGCRDGGQEFHLPHLFSPVPVHWEPAFLNVLTFDLSSKVFWVRICPHPAGIGLLVALRCFWGTGILAQDDPWRKHEASHFAHKHLLGSQGHP